MRIVFQFDCQIAPVAFALSKKCTFKVQVANWRRIGICDSPSNFFLSPSASLLGSSNKKGELHVASSLNLPTESPPVSEAHSKFKFSDFARDGDAQSRVVIDIIRTAAAYY